MTAKCTIARGGFEAPTRKFYNDCVKNKNSSGAYDFIRGLHISHARLDELRSDITDGLAREKLYGKRVDTKQPAILLDPLYEAIEAKYSFLTTRSIPRSWRNRAIESFVGKISLEQAQDTEHC